MLRSGSVVALPTETVYGLGGNALDAGAVAKIFEAKQRPGWDPLIVHVCDEAMLATVVAEIPNAARKLIAAFWPGPLTLLLPRSAAVPDAITAGRPLVGVRMPAHPVALELIRRAGVPIAAPSANRFGHSSPTTAEHVLHDLDGRIAAVVDAGPTAFGVESTVVDATASPLVIYRPGAITSEQIRAIAGPAEYFQELDALAAMPREALPSPGVGLRHYAPNARLVLLELEDEATLPRRMFDQARLHPGDRIGMMVLVETPGMTDLEPVRVDEVEMYFWGYSSRPEQLAQRLFAGLRHLDSAGCTVILCPLPAAQGIGIAIRDRLRKAATPREI